MSARSQQEKEENRVYIDLETMEENTNRISARRKYIARKRQEDAEIQELQHRSNSRTIGKSLLVFAAVCALCSAVFHTTAIRRTVPAADDPGITYVEEEGIAFPEGSMAVYDEEGNVLADPSSPDFEDLYVYGMEENAHDYIFSGPIRIGSTWQDFVNAYGDYTAESIYFSNASGSSSSSMTISNMTIHDFDQEYIQSGKVNMRDPINIQFTSYIGRNNQSYLTQEGAGGYQNVLRYDSIHFTLYVPEEVNNAKDPGNLLLQSFDVYSDTY